MEAGGAEAGQNEQNGSDTEGGRQPNHADQDTREHGSEDHQQLEVLAVGQVTDHRLHQVGDLGAGGEQTRLGGAQAEVLDEDGENGGQVRKEGVVGAMRGGNRDHFRGLKGV